jgi:hypothetical protein
MATSQDSAVLAIYGQRTNFTNPSILSPVTRDAIRNVRTLCTNAEKTETTMVSWRRGSGPPRSDTGGKGPTGHSSGGSKHGWRGHGNGFTRNAQSGQSNGGAPAGSSTEKQPPHTRYVSKFLNTDSPVEDKILNQIILNKLNKFSTANYNDVKEFVQQVLDGDEKEFIHDFMLLVFKKAACEPTFCPLYAKLVSELRVGYPQLQDELNRLYETYMNIFEEIDEKQCKDYEQFVQRNKEKHHRLGYSQFLGELTRLGVLDQTQLSQLYGRILTQITSVAAHEPPRQILVEEYVDCLLRMTNALKGPGLTNVEPIRQALQTACENQLETLLANRSSLPGLSKKASFAIMDCLDILRATGR